MATHRSLECQRNHGAAETMIAGSPDRDSSDDARLKSFRPDSRWRLEFDGRLSMGRRTASPNDFGSGADPRLAATAVRLAQLAPAAGRPSTRNRPPATPFRGANSVTPTMASRFLRKFMAFAAQTRSAWTKTGMDDVMTPILLCAGFPNMTSPPIRPSCELPSRSQIHSCGMAGPRVVRKLAAIVAADVVGYSRLMGEDEEGAFRRLRELQTTVSWLVERHGGRTVKTAGDSMLLDFSSTVAALECAIAVQQSLERSNAECPEDRKMLLRIGINVGPVIVDGDDIFGEVVNVAVRLEAIAEPGGICLSRATYAQYKGKLAVEFVDMGDQTLKNIAEPVRAYAVPPQRAGVPAEAASTKRTLAARNESDNVLDFKTPRLSVAGAPNESPVGAPRSLRAISRTRPCSQRPRLPAPNSSAVTSATPFRTDEIFA